MTDPTDRSEPSLITLVRIVYSGKGYAIVKWILAKEEDVGSNEGELVACHILDF